MNLESCIVICKNIRGNFMKVENPLFMQKNGRKSPICAKNGDFHLLPFAVLDLPPANLLSGYLPLPSANGKLCMYTACAYILH